MKNKEIRELTPDELRARKRELREQVFHVLLHLVEFLRAGGLDEQLADVAAA